MKKTTFAFFFLFSAAALFGQYAFYYGKNKIVRQAFPWKYAETKNFRIYHYMDDQELLRRLPVKRKRPITSSPRF